MKWCLMGGVLGVGLLALASTRGQGPASKGALQKGWYLNYEAARAAARQSGKPMMVVFRCEP
jgi:hypothetical protein